MPDSVLSENAVVAEKYRVVRFVEESRRMRTYVATQLASGRSVALKVMRLEDAAPDARTRFLQEARDPSVVEGARVLEVIESDILGAQPFVAMVLPEARPGASRPAPSEKAAEYVSTVAMAPGEPPPPSAIAYQATVAMSPDGSVSDEVAAARAEAAKVEAAMKSARRTVSPAPAKKSSAPILLLVLLVLLVGAGVAYFVFLRR